MDPTGHFLLTALLIGAGLVVSGVMTGVNAALSRLEDETFMGAFTGGFIDGIIGALGVTVGLAVGGGLGFLVAGGISFIGGFAGNAIGQGISYGFDDIDYGVAALQGAFSAITNVATYGVFETAKIVQGATFAQKFVDAGKISTLGVAITSWFTYYGFPNTNKLRKKK